MRYIEEADKTLIKKFDEIRQKGYYVNSNQVTSLYNKILEKNVNNTTCGSCLRGRIQELVNALKRQEQAEKKAQEAAKKAEEETKVAEVENTPEEPKEAVEEAKTEEVDNVPQEEKEENTEEINEAQSDICDELVIEEVKEEPKDVDNKESHKTKGRKKKQEPAG